MLPLNGKASDFKTLFFLSFEKNLSCIQDCLLEWKVLTVSAKKYYSNYSNSEDIFQFDRDFLFFLLKDYLGLPSDN